MTAQEEPDGHEPSSATEPTSDSLVAGVSTLDVGDRKRGSEGQPTAIDFVTMGMFIIGEYHHGVHLAWGTHLPANPTSR